MNIAKRRWRAIKRSLIWVASMVCGYSIVWGHVGLAEFQSKKSGLYTYELNEDASVTIVGFDWGMGEGNLAIPSTIDGYPVKAIGESAFEQYETHPQNVERITITLPQTLEEIGERAFFHVAANTVNIPDKLERIGAGALVFDCSEIKYIVSPDHANFAVIDGNLYNKKRKSLISTSTHIQSSREKDYEIPEGINEIEGYAFYRAPIHTLKLPSTIRVVGTNAFLQAKFSNEEYSMDTMAAYFARSDKTETLEGKGELKNAINLSQAEKLGEAAFMAASLSDVTFSYPKTLIAIPEALFAEASIPLSGGFNIPEKCESIGKRAFMNTYIPSPYVVEICLPDSMRQIDDEAFCGITNFKSIDLGNSLRTIGKNCFKNSGLENVVFHNHCEEIQEGAFSSTKLESVTIIGSELHIDDGAFSDNSALENVVIGEGVVYIGDRCFSNCPELTNVVISQSVESIGEDAFDKSTVKINVNRGSYAEDWAKENGYDYSYTGEENDYSWLTQ